MAAPTASPTVSSTVGLKNMVIAPLTEDTEETVSYGTLQAVAGAIEATITPESADPDVQYADDVEFDTLYPDPEISFSTSMADIPLTIQEMIFGNQIDDNGVLVRTATDKPPYFAVGFMSEKANHKFRFIWLYKVRAKPMTETYKTKEGQTITRQNGSVEWTAIKRTHSDSWCGQTAGRLAASRAQAFGSAFADGIIERDPTVGLVRPKAHKKKERRALTPFETKSVLKTIETHEHGLLLAVLYYTGLRRGEALGLKWSDFDWNDNLVHVQRDIDYMTTKPKEGELKTQAAERYVPIPPALRKLLLPRREFGECYVFHTKDGSPLPQSSFQRIWLSLMMDAGCVVEREITADTNRARDVRKRYKATLTPHYFRHNYVTLLYEAGVDPLVAMKIVGHRDYQTTANIYTHLKEETLKKAAFDMDSVFSGKKISANMGKQF